MPQKGQKLENPQTGDSCEFLETSADTNGEYVRVKVTLKSKGLLIPNHVHCFQDERFEVISGKLTIIEDGQTKILYAGQRKFLPKGEAHNHYNNHSYTTVYIHTITPALDYDYLLETLDGLRKDGKIRKGRVPFLQQMVFLKYLDSQRVLADVHPGIQKVMVNALGLLGRFLGYRAIYKKYSGFEK